MPLADNNGPLSACFYVMCRQAPLQSRAMHPQTIEHLRPTLWPAPSQTVRRSQAARRRLRRRALIFRFEARAALVGPHGLAKCGTVNVITSGEHGLHKTDGITFEEQETDSRTCKGDRTIFYNADVNQRSRPHHVLHWRFLHHCRGAGQCRHGRRMQLGVVQWQLARGRGRYQWTRKLSPRTSHQTQKVAASSWGSMNSRCLREVKGITCAAMILIPVVLQRRVGKYAVRALRRRCQFRHRHHRTRPVLQP